MNWPVVAIWIRPGRAVEGLIEGQTGHRAAVLIAACLGVLQVRPLLVETYAGDRTPGPAMAALAVSLAAIAGVAGIFLFAWLYRNFSRWFGGSGDLRQTRTAFGWGLLPLTALFAALFVVSLTRPEWIGRSEEQLTPLIALIAVWFVYAYAVLLLAAAKAQRLSPLRAFAALVVTFLVSVFPITLMAQALVAVVGG